MARVNATGDVDERVYMVVGEDENGDHHVFVTSDLGRAEARRRVVLDQLTNLKANWLERWGEPGQ